MPAPGAARARPAGGPPRAVPVQGFVGFRTFATGPGAATGRNATNGRVEARARRLHGQRMTRIARDSDTIELDGPPAFDHGERVASRFNVRNDGTFGGREIGDLLVGRGDIGVVVSVGTFLQQYYIYEVEFIEHGYRVGMKGRELVSLENLPPHVQEALGADKLEQLQALLRAA